MIDIAAACLVVTALLAWINRRFVGLPTSIGVMAASMLLSFIAIALDAKHLLHGPHVAAEELARSVDFSDVVMQGMLSFLLFAGGVHVDVRALRRFRTPVLALAFAGTLMSAFVVGGLMAWLLPLVGVSLSFGYCLLFGALISPTDPIAVGGILRGSKAPPDVRVVIEGESLFNDGVGVALFVLVLEAITSGAAPTAGDVGITLLREVGGGIALGFLLGWSTYALLSGVDQYDVEVLITLATVMGGYALAQNLHVSGPLAMAIAGVVVGHRARERVMSEITRRYVDMFWELIDGILNAVLFVLLGMGVLVIAFSRHELLAGALAVLVTLAARALTVGVPVAVLGKRVGLPAGSWSVLTWGGLRGGISVALALSMPAGAPRGTLIALTYCVVVFSVLVQGLTIGRVVGRAFHD
jgi:CPA1 family monovalent cation:H+ antiporter